MKKTIILMLCLFCSVGAMAQKKAITGLVKDATGEVIIGASVVEIGTTNGVITDLEGRFSLEVNPEGKIRVSYIGYESQTVEVKNRVSFSFHLKEDSELLEEVVVTGYGGTQLRSKVTSAISKVSEKAITSGLKANPVAALAGTVSGLVVQQNSGKPGATPSVVLRGGTSLGGGGTPLYVIDGVVRPISDFNPEDIESMEVLKDASATSIYGARANNGVILISTKKGKNGKAEISFKAKTGLSYMSYLPEFLNAGDYIYWQRMGFKNASESGSSTVKGWMGLLKQANGFGTGNMMVDPNTGAVLDGNKDSRAIYSTMILDDNNRFKLQQGWKTMKDPVYGDDLIYNEFNFKNEAFRDMALTQDYNVSVSGGNEKGSYYLGLGYYDEKGFPMNTWYKRLNFTLNADYKITDWITSYSSFSFADAKWRDQAHLNEETYFGRMLSVPPTMRGYNENGELLMGVHYKDGNPNFSADRFVRNNNSDKFAFSQIFKFDLTKNIYLKVVGNWLYSETINESMNKDFYERPGILNTTRSTSAGFGRELSQTYNVIAGWKHNFKKHNIDLLGGFEYYDWYKIGFNASGQQAPTDDFLDLGLTSSEANKRGIDSWHERQRIMSGFGKLNYDYDGKYLVSLTAREDGYSKLRDNRWGFFPGISLGWNLLKEDFMQNTTSILSFLKIRAGYGQNGNVNPNYIGSYTLQGSYGTAGKYGGILGFAMGSLPTPSLRWEKSATFDAAVDVSFLDNKYNLTVGVFSRTTDDLLANVGLPTSSGYSTILTNNGSVRNRGLELEANVDLIQTNDWKWNIGANITYIKNVITKLPDNGNDNNRQGGQQVYTGRQLEDGSYEKIWVGGYQEGQRPGGMYGYIAEGIYQNEDEIRQHGIKKDVTTYYGTTYSADEYAKLSGSEQAKNHYILAPGDVKWKDINGDGIIDQYDQAYLGNSNPTWTGGLNTTLTWKSLSLYVRLDYALGHTIYDYIRQGFLANGQGEFNTLVEVKDTWSPTNTGAKYPRYDRADPLVKSNYRGSTLFAYKGNYLCFRDVTLSYSLPKVLLEKVNIKNIVLSATGQNLGYLKSDILTPEGRGIARSGYPLPLSIVFGAQLTF